MFNKGLVARPDDKMMGWVCLRPYGLLTLSNSVGQYYTKFSHAVFAFGGFCLDLEGSSFILCHLFKELMAKKPMVFHKVVRASAVTPGKRANIKSCYDPRSILYSRADTCE
jgi:hypothetical protein